MRAIQSALALCLVVVEAFTPCPIATPQLRYRGVNMQLTDDFKFGCGKAVGGPYANVRSYGGAGCIVTVNTVTQQVLPVPVSPGPEGDQGPIAPAPVAAAPAPEPEAGEQEAAAPKAAAPAPVAQKPWAHQRVLKESASVQVDKSDFAFGIGIPSGGPFANNRMYGGANCIEKIF